VTAATVATDIPTVGEAALLLLTILLGLLDMVAVWRMSKKQSRTASEATRS
jgi:hypothetical protein